MNKYKINITHLETPGGIAKLERDGFNREKIIKTMYNITYGANTSQRTEIIDKLYNRQEPC